MLRGAWRSCGSSLFAAAGRAPVSFSALVSLIREVEARAWLRPRQRTQAVEPICWAAYSLVLQL